MQHYVPTASHKAEVVESVCRYFFATPKNINNKNPPFLLRSKEELSNLYLFGSRLYGTFKPASDFDFIAIVNTKEYFDVVEQFEYDDIIEGEQISINLNIYHVYFWQECLLKSQFTWAILVSYFLPEDMKYTETYKFPEYKLNSLKLKQSAMQDSAHNFQKAKRLWQKENDITKSKKNIVHGIRHSLFALQLLQHEKLVDIKCANEYHVKIFDTAGSTQETWEQCSEKYKECTTTAMFQVKHFKPSFQEKYDQLFQAEGSELPFLLNFVNTCGVQTLFKDLAVQMETQATQQHELYYLAYDREDTPLSLEFSTLPKYSPSATTTSKEIEIPGGTLIQLTKEIADMVHQCTGVVLLKSLGNSTTPCPYSVLCMTHDFIDTFEYEDTTRSRALFIDWDYSNPSATTGLSFEVTEKLDGIHCSLYFDPIANRWRVFTTEKYKQQFKRDLTTTIGSFRRIYHDVNHQELDKTVEELFWMEWKRLGYALPGDTNCSYSFEMVVPRDTSYKNHVVQDLEDTGLFLFFVRDLRTLQEVPSTEIASKNAWKHVPVHTSHMIQLHEKKQKEMDEIMAGSKRKILALSDTLMEYCRKHMDPTKQEGFVVRDRNGTRLQFISPQFQALKSFQFFDINNRFTNERNLFELVRSNSLETFMKYDPESESGTTTTHSIRPKRVVPWFMKRDLFLKYYQETKSRYDNCLNSLSKIYADLEEKSKGDLQQFAALSKKFNLNFVFFFVKNNASGSMREFFASCNMKKLMQCIEFVEKGKF